MTAEAFSSSKSWCPSSIAVPSRRSALRTAGRGRRGASTWASASASFASSAGEAKGEKRCIEA
ncbi:MAG TPA: hypothetical protein VFS43_24875 [Polyangiaceae bacterium]|nr:hypothetical protein [Polyangiaceae bacterium]